MLASARKLEYAGELDVVNDDLAVLSDGFVAQIRYTNCMKQGL